MIEIWISMEFQFFSTLSTSETNEIVDEFCRKFSISIDKWQVWIFTKIQSKLEKEWWRRKNSMCDEKNFSLNAKRRWEIFRKIADEFSFKNFIFYVIWWTFHVVAYFFPFSQCKMTNGPSRALPGDDTDEFFLNKFYFHHSLQMKTTKIFLIKFIQWFVCFNYHIHSIKNSKAISGNNCEDRKLKFSYQRSFKKEINFWISSSCSLIKFKGKREQHHNSSKSTFSQLEALKTSLFVVHHKKEGNLFYFLRLA